MDKKWRPSQRDGSKPYKKGRNFGFRERPLGPVDPSTAAEDLAEYIIKVLTRSPDDLQITREVFSPGHIRISVSCDPAFTGRLIGKGGKTITNLRSLVKAAAQRRGKRVDIEVTS